MWSIRQVVNNIAFIIEQQKSIENIPPPFIQIISNLLTELDSIADGELMDNEDDGPQLKERLIALSYKSVLGIICHL